VKCKCLCAAFYIPLRNNNRVSQRIDPRRMELRRQSNVVGLVSCIITSGFSARMFVLGPVRFDVFSTTIHGLFTASTKFQVRVVDATVSTTAVVIFVNVPMHPAVFH